MVDQITESDPKPDTSQESDLQSSENDEPMNTEFAGPPLKKVPLPLGGGGGGLLSHISQNMTQNQNLDLTTCFWGSIYV